MARISGSQKLFRLDLDTGKKTQLTFGTQDEARRSSWTPTRIIFSSTATDPATPLTPEVARNGNIFNLWSLSLKNGELQQYTDALGGVLSPVVLSKDGAGAAPGVRRLLQGRLQRCTRFDLKEPLHTAASSDFGSPGPIIDFQAPLQHTLVAENKSKKGRFEKMFLDGRPPVNIGVTSGGDVFGGSMVSFTDVLGDQQFSMYASSVQQYKTMSFSYLNLSRRLQWALQGYSQTQFFYGQLSQYFYDPAIAPFISRDDALATQTVRGGSIFGIYPFSTYRRVELSGGLVALHRGVRRPGACSEAAASISRSSSGTQLFNNGMMMPLGVSFIQETTVFREYGPLSGSTMRLSFEVAPKVGNSLSRRRSTAMRATTCGSARTACSRCAPTASRAGAMRRTTRSSAATPKCAATTTASSSATRGSTPTPSSASRSSTRWRRPSAFSAASAASSSPMSAERASTGSTFKIWDNNTRSSPTRSATRAASSSDRPQRIEGFRLVDARASYGIGLETFALGFPVHFDWSYRTLFNKEWENFLLRQQRAAAQDSARHVHACGSGTTSRRLLKLESRELVELGIYAT